MAVWGIAVSPDGTTLISDTRIWNLTAGAEEGGEFEPVKVIEEEKNVMNVAFTPDGTKFCLGLGEHNAGLIHVYSSTLY